MPRLYPPDWASRAGGAASAPSDPVNAMLSFGYSLLPDHAVMALIDARLSPPIGLFHQPRGVHLTRASDLVEEVPHRVESVARIVLRGRQIQPEGFRGSADVVYPALLSRSARKTFLYTFERRSSTELTPEPAERLVRPTERRPPSRRAPHSRSCRRRASEP